MNTIKIQIIIMRFSLILILLSLFSACKTINTSSQPIIYHQHYTPVKSTKIYNLMYKTFDEVKKLYGNPISPVNEIYIYKSTRRKNLANIAIADVQNWNLLLKNLKSNQAINKILFKNYPPLNEYKTLKNKSAVIFYLNSLINAKDLCKNVDINKIRTSCKIKKYIKICKSWFFFKNSRLLANRNLLDSILKDSILRCPQKSMVGENFALCEILNKEKGIFIIYLYGDEKSSDFKLLLFHETAHLLNAELRDWYVEGFNNVFAEYMAKKIGGNWKYLDAKFAKDKPYAIAYKIMRDIKSVSPKSYDKLLKYAKGDVIDIKQWLLDIPKKKREKIKTIILRYSHSLNEVKGLKNKFILDLEELKKSENEIKGENE